MSHEQNWIKAILHRNSLEAAEKIVSAYYDDVYYYVYRQVGGREDALDVTQEIFIAALQSLAAFDHRKASFRTWLFRIASHKIIDSRRRVIPVTVSLDDEEIAKDDFAGSVADKLLLEQIETYVCTLDPQIQEIFRLRIYADYSFPEIARITGQAEEKVKAQYYRLSKKLKKEFEPHA